MLEPTESSFDISALHQRLDALNEILGGMRGVLLQDQQDLQTLLQKGQEAEDRFGVVEQWKDELDALTEQVLEISEKLEVEAPATENEAPAIDPERITALEQRVIAVSQIMSELKVHLQEKAVASSDDSEIQATLHELTGKFGEQHHKLQEIKDHLRSFGARFEEWEKRLATSDDQLQQVRNGLSRQAQSFVERQSHNESKVEEVRQQLSDGLETLRGEQKSAFEAVYQDVENSLEDQKVQQQEAAASRAQIEANLDDLLQKTNGIRSSMDDQQRQQDGFFGRLEGLEQGLSLFREYVDGIRSKADNTEVESHARLRELSHQIEAAQGVLDGLAQREVTSRARDSELRNSIEEISNKVSSLQCEMGERLDHEATLVAQWEETQRSWSEAFDGAVEQNKDLAAEIAQIKDSHKSISNEIEDRSEKQAESVTRELTLARDYIEDQQKRVNNDLDGLKRNQREMGGWRQELDHHSQEQKSSRQEIHRLEERIGALQGDLRRSRTGTVVAFAATFALVCSTFLFQDAVDTVVPAPLQITQTPERISLEPLPLGLEEDMMGESVNWEEPTVTEESTAEPMEEPTVAEATVVMPAYSTPAVLASNVEEPMEGDLAADDRVITYTVQDGDNLWKIAKKHRNDLPLMERIERIKQDNQLENADIKPDMVLRIFL